MVSHADGYFLPAELASRVFQVTQAEQISANISVTWEPDGILAYHRRQLSGGRSQNCDGSDGSLIPGYALCCLR